MPLEPDDPRHLTAAQGYVELGMPEEAYAELEFINAEVRHVPEVLEVRVDIYHALQKWDLLQSVARNLVEHEPQNDQWWISWAYAIRRIESVEAAKLILLDALEAVPNEGRSTSTWPATSACLGIWTRLASRSGRRSR